MFTGPKIVIDGLVLTLDAASHKSYPGSGTAVYSLGSNISGSLTNGTTFSSENQGVFTFDGTDDYIHLSDALSLTNTSFSVETWIKWDGGSTDTFFGHNDAPFAAQKALHWRIYDTGLLRLDFYSNSINSSTGAIIADTWYHLLATYDYGSDTCKCYRNGELLMQGSAGPYIGTQSSTNTYLGIWSPPSSQPFGGEMAIFRQYSRALTAEEVQQNYKVTKSRFGK